MVFIRRVDKMKKIFSIILAAVLMMTALCVYSDAKASYNVSFVLTANANGKNYSSGDTITVAPGSTVDVTLSLKNDFMIGNLSTQIFYDNSIFESETGKFNTNGVLYNACGKSMVQFTKWSQIAQSYKDRIWPDYSAAKLKDFKANHNFCYITMATDVNRIDSPVKNIDEQIITVTFKVSPKAKNGETGQIIIPTESLRRKDYLNGYTFCSVYTKDDLTTTPSPYVDGLSYDMSKAVLNFKVGTASSVTLGDVNKDGSINSSDALMILQHTVGQINLTGDAKTAADVTKDGAINSSDALKVLQYSVGNIKSL